MQLSLRRLFRLPGAIGPYTFLLLGWSTLSGCVVEAPPNVLVLTSAQPTDVELGERMEVTGVGFPTQRPAIVKLVGMVMRPGREASAVSLEVRAEAKSTERIGWIVTDEMMRGLSGSGDKARHATFRGKISVTFPPAEGGSAPMVGRLDGVVLDARPAALAGPTRRLLEQEAARFLDYLGVKLTSASPASGGVQLQTVLPRSRGDGLGLREGDIITEVEGLRVLGAMDLSPPDHNHLLLRVRRLGEPEPLTLSLSLEGYRNGVTHDVMLALLLLALGVVGISVLTMRTPTWWPNRQHYMTQQATTERTPTPLRPVAMAAVLAAALSLGSRISILSDMGVAYVASLLTLGGGMAIFAKHKSARTKVNLFEYLLELPAVLVLGSMIVRAGGFRLDEFAELQGGAPWSFLALRDPLGALTLLFLFGRGLRPQGSAATLRVYLASALATLLFFGGTRVPGISPSEQASSIAYLFLGSALLVVKTLLLGRIVQPLERHVEQMSGTRRVALMVSATGAALVSLALSLGRLVIPIDDRTSRLIAWAVLALVGWLVLLFGVRRVAAARKSSYLSLDPSI